MISFPAGILRDSFMDAYLLQLREESLANFLISSLLNSEFLKGLVFFHYRCIMLNSDKLRGLVLFRGV